MMMNTTDAKAVGSYYLITMQKRCNILMGLSTKKPWKYIVKNITIEHDNLFGDFYQKGSKPVNYAPGAVPLNYIDQIYCIEK